MVEQYYISSVMALVGESFCHGRPGVVAISPAGGKLALMAVMKLVGSMCGASTVDCEDGASTFSPSARRAHEGSSAFGAFPRAWLELRDWRVGALLVCWGPGGPCVLRLPHSKKSPSMHLHNFIQSFFESCI